MLFYANILVPAEIGRSICLYYYISSAQSSKEIIGESLRPKRSKSANENLPNPPAPFTQDPPQPDPHQRGLHPESSEGLTGPPPSPHRREASLPQPPRAIGSPFMPCRALPPTSQYRSSVPGSCCPAILQNTHLLL